MAASSIQLRYDQLLPELISTLQEAVNLKGEIDNYNQTLESVTEYHLDEITRQVDEFSKKIATFDRDVEEPSPISKYSTFIEVMKSTEDYQTKNYVHFDVFNTCFLNLVSKVEQIRNHTLQRTVDIREDIEKGRDPKSSMLMYARRSDRWNPLSEYFSITKGCEAVGLVQKGFQQGGGI
ncbi:MAG: hypothetical protein KAR79_03980 [Simkaniaceae bacterium]|nr:hypothetical protein [Simkaniaceae bacterium]